MIFSIEVICFSLCLQLLLKPIVFILRKISIIYSNRASYHFAEISLQFQKIYCVLYESVCEDRFLVEKFFLF